MASFVENADGLLVPESMMRPNRASVYCDESGNSGPNYVDLQQPFYVLAGWLVPDDRVVEVSVLIDEFRKEHFRQRDELKADAVLRNDKTKIKCVDLFRELGQHHCVPIYLVAEKRFCIAGKIVETFMDPLYHKFLKNSFIVDVETKQEIANTLYERLPDKVIAQFANAYRAPSAPALGQALLEVMTAIEANVSPELAKAVAGCKEFIDEIAAVEAAISPLGDVAGTLNMPCLVSFLMLVENLGRLGLARPIKVLHDQQHAYEEGYKRIFEMHKGMPRFFARLPQTEMPFTNLEHVAEFEMRDSLTSMPIQAADLLAGAIHHCCRLAMGSQQLTPGDHALAESILPGLLMSAPRLTWLICSNRCIRAVGKRVLTPALQATYGITDDVKTDDEGSELLGPVFPVKGGKVTPKDGFERVKLDLPLYGLVGKNSGGLMGINNSEAEDEVLKRYVFLFSTEEGAKEVLEMWEPEDLSQPQEVVAFGPPELTRLIELLEDAGKWTDYIAFDFVAGEKLRLMKLHGFTNDIKRIWSRILRAFRTGMNNVLVETHQIGAVEVTSIQSNDGQYGAMIQPKGAIYFADSRENAVEALRKGEGI